MGSRSTLAHLVDLKAGFSRVATGFQFTEGPVWEPGRSVLLFSDIPASRIWRLDGTGTCVVEHEPSDRANGLTLDHEGRLLACEHGTRRVTRRSADGSRVVVAERYSGSRLNSPNDVTVSADGTIWFTDPPYGIRPEHQELSFQGLFRLSSDGELAPAIDDLDRPNGLAFSPDETLLYVADSSARRHLRRFLVKPGGELDGGEVFVDMNVPMPGVPDGLKVDREGNVYSTGPGGIWVIDPSGRHLGTLLVPETAANCAWGDDDGCSLFVTATTSVYRFRVRVPGAHRIGSGGHR